MKRVNERIRQAKRALRRGDFALARIACLQAKRAIVDATEIENARAVGRLWEKTVNMYKQSKDFWSRFETTPTK